MTETMTNEAVKKPAIDEEDKIALGQKLGAILRKYPNSRQLREAQIPITLTVFEKLAKGSAKGNILELEGIVESIDFAQNRVILEGRRIKLGEIIRVSVPSSFEEDEYVENEYENSYDERLRSSQDDNDSEAEFQYDGDSDPTNDSIFGAYYPDDMPDYGAETRMRQKEALPSRHPKKTILYTSKTGYRPRYETRA